MARELGFPVVLKVYSQTITHKTDVGGVQLNLGDETVVRKAYRKIEAAVLEKAGADRFEGVTVQRMVSAQGYELIIGSSVDPQFGPVVLFGSGGQLVEVYQDRALALPPLNATLAQRLIEQTRIFAALRGIRGRDAIDISELQKILVCFSRLLVEQPWIKESDINPLLAAPGKIIALDARIVTYPVGTDAKDLPKPAIRPYPTQYMGHWKTKDGRAVTIRPIRPEDELLMVKFHETLSEQSVYLRYFHMEKLDSRTAHERLLRKCFIDYNREMALVVERQDAQTGEHEILAVGRLTKTRDSSEAEVAVLVRDQAQNQGLGTELVRRLIEVARDENIVRIVAIILPENYGMMALARHFQFTVQESQDPSLIVAALNL